MTETELNTIINDYSAFIADLKAVAVKHHHQCEGTIELPGIDCFLMEIKVITSMSDAYAYVAWWMDGDEDEEPLGSSPMFTSAQTAKLKEMLSRLYAAGAEFEATDDVSEDQVDAFLAKLAAIAEEYDLGN